MLLDVIWTVFILNKNWNMQHKKSEVLANVGRKLCSLSKEVNKKYKYLLTVYYCRI